MKHIKKILIVFLSLILLFFAFALWYKYQYSMDEANSYEVNSISFTKKLLIATQGSDFKNKLTEEVVAHYKPDSVYIKVIDISSLKNMGLEDYNGILIIHTWEYSKPPPIIQFFMDNDKYIPEKMVVFNTSGEGSYKMDNVDAITGASKMENTGIHVDKIVTRLNSIINNPNQ